MPTYTTVKAKNLATGQPFVFEVSQEDLDLFERQKQYARNGRSWFLANENEAISYFEFKLFPAYDDVLKTSGLTHELLTKILQGFGLENPAFIAKLLEDRAYISSIEPWFTGIACASDRASRTIGIVYEATQRLYTAKTDDRPLHPDLI